MADKVFDKLPYGICGILLGSLGVNSFIAGNIGMGILKILFSWTGIPGIVGLIQGIIALCRPEAMLRQTGIFSFEGVEGNSFISGYKV
jgi:TM2 domain-containing membrane protein YozV